MTRMPRINTTSVRIALAVPFCIFCLILTRYSRIKCLTLPFLFFFASNSSPFDTFYVPQSSVPGLWNVVLKPIRVVEKHSIRWSLSQFDTEICQASLESSFLFGTTGCGHHSLWLETWKYSIETSQEEWCQSHWFWIIMSFQQTNVFVYPKPILSVSGGHAWTALQHRHRHVESRLHIGRDAYRRASLFWVWSIWSDAKDCQGKPWDTRFCYRLPVVVSLLCIY